MSTNFPTSLDALLNPIGTDALANADPGLEHHAQHENANDAIEAMETKIGVTGSAVATSLDYLLKNILSLDPGHKHASVGLVRAIVTVTNTYVVEVSDETVVGNKTTDFVITLFPAVSATIGQKLVIKNINTGKLIVTADATGTPDLIDGETTQTVDQWASMQLQCNAANSWIII